jgi:ABC-type multidrug transport system fused ATPase/permease subunit
MANKTGKAFDWSIFFRLYKYSQPYKLWFFFTLFLVLALAGMAVIRPEQMRSLLDEALPSGDGHAVLWISLSFLGVLLLETVIQYVQTYVANWVAQRITLDLRSTIFKKTIHNKLAYFDKTPVGQLVTRHISDVDGIAEVFSVGLLDIVRDILKLVVILGFMLYLDWKMALVVMLPIPVLIWATRLFQKAVKNSFQDVRNEVARMNVFVQEHLTGMHLIQLFNNQKREQRKFEEINQSHRDAHIRGIWAYSVFFPVVELLSASSVALLLWFGVKQSLSLDISPGLILEFSTFITMMYRPIRQMADNFNVLQMGVVNAERVFKLIDEDNSETDHSESALEEVRGSISFEDVTFSYVEGQPIFERFDLNIEAGKHVAIVGSTGSGKTTIISLLNRFYNLDSGSIFIDSKNINNISLSSLRRTIGVVLQDVFLFSDSIRNNLKLYDESITDESMIQASKQVGAHDFIMALPGGYDFDVKERGTLLSTGQRQLLAFVRVFLQNPKIVILDEATSSVDTDSEILIQRATELLSVGRTTIAIAHRLSTIKNSDVIYVLEKGRVVESGSHEELMTLGGHYCNLVELQFSEK